MTRNTFKLFLAGFCCFFSSTVSAQTFQGVKGYFSDYLNYGDTINRQHDDSIAYVVLIHMREMQKVDEFQVELKDKRGDVVARETIDIVESGGQAFHKQGAKRIYVADPHPFKVIVDKKTAKSIVKLVVKQKTINGKASVLTTKEVKQP